MTMDNGQWTMDNEQWTNYKLQWANEIDLIVNILQFVRCQLSVVNCK